MARPRKLARELLTLEDANGAMREMLQAQVELEKLQGALDLARAEATARFEDRMDQQKSAILEIEGQLQTWYLTRAEKAPGKKSVQLAYGVIGERLGHPALKPMNRKWTWAAIEVLLRSKFDAKYFHQPAAPGPDKEKIRAELSEDQLKECGLKIDQPEKFYIELDRSTLGDPR